MITIASSMTTSMTTYICQLPVNILNSARALLESVVDVDVTENVSDEKVESMLYSVRTARKGRAAETAKSSCLRISQGEIMMEGDYPPACGIS